MAKVILGMTVSLGCPGTSIRTGVLDAQVWAWIETIRRNPRMAQSLADRLRGTGEDEGRAVAMLASLYKRIGEVEGQRARLAKRMALVDDDDVPLVQRELKNLAEEKRDLEAQRPSFESQVAASDCRRERVDRAIGIIEGTLPVRDDLTWDEKRRVLSDLGVVVHPHASDHTPRWSMMLAFDNDRGSMRAEANERVLVEWWDGDGDDPYFYFGNVSSTRRAIGATDGR